MLARTLAVAVLGALALIAAPANAAKTPDLTLTRVSSPPASLKAGASFNLRIRIDNDGKVARGGKLTTTLQDGPAGYNVPKRIGRITVEKLDPDLYRSYRIRLTIPFAAKSGKYTLRTCLKSQGKQQCATSPRFSVAKS